MVCREKKKKKNQIMWLYLLHGAVTPQKHGSIMSRIGEIDVGRNNVHYLSESLQTS